MTSATTQKVIEAVPPDSSPSLSSNVVQIGISPSASWEPLPPDSTTSTFSEWVRFGQYPNFLAAHIVAERLRIDEVPTMLTTMGAYPDIDNAEIWIPKGLVHRARWVLAWGAPSDAELTFLATGELPQKPDD